MTTIAENLAVIKSRIAEYATKYGRDNSEICLLAASKTQTSEKITAAYSAGQRDFGENYLQEGLAKIAACADLTITWHFIGPIQRNKTKKIAEHFAWVHSVDSMLIAKRLSDQRPAHLPPLNICIEVNVSNEETKSGVKIDEVLTLAAYCQTLPNLRLRGLMAIPTEYHTFDEQRHEFHKLAQLKQILEENNFALDTLSMGMSGDFEAAIAEGATIVRIGTAIFGARVQI